MNRVQWTTDVDCEVTAIPKLPAFRQRGV